MNVYMNQIIQQVFPTHIQLKQDVPMSRIDDNISDNFRPYKDKKSLSKAQAIEENHKNLVEKSLDTGIHAKTKRISQDRLLGSESSLFLREIRFSKEEFPTGTPVSNIKFNYPRLQNDNLFYPFYNYLDYALAHYFAEFETTKGNVDKFPSNPFMVLLIERLSLQNADK